MQENESPREEKKILHSYFLGIGSNINPQINLPISIKMLSRYVLINGVSTAWQTEAVGSEGPDYLNAVVEVHSKYPPEYMKDIIIKRIETDLGRVRTNDKNSPRTIDLDILIYDTQILDRDIWKYAYLAVPLAELSPNYKNPTTCETIGEAAERLSKRTLLIPRPEVLSKTSIYKFK